MKKFLSTTLFCLILGLGLLQTGSVQAAFDQDLGFGAQGAKVSELQAFLNRQAVYQGPINGSFGPLTREGVRSFQIREGITPANGRFGPLTRAKASGFLARANQPNLAERLAALIAQLNDLKAKLNAPPAQATSTEPSLEAGAIVGLNCYFKYLPTGQIFNLGKGSGAIVRSDGLILTARHLVDLDYSYRVDAGSTSANLATNSILDHCDVGQVPAGSVLPSPDLIRSINPSTQVPLLAYRAVLAFLPKDIRESAAEEQALDFSLLQITGLSEAGALYGQTLPARFPAVPFFTANVLKPGDEVLTYGYPGDITEAKQGAFNTFYLAGGAGRVKSVLYGDQFFRDTPVTVNMEMEVRPGRSGSPLFHKGSLVGVITAHSLENVTDSFAVSSQAILEIVRRAGISL